MKIKNKVIDFDSSVYVIAEIGINHNAKIENALKMVRDAKKADCNAIKLQVIDAEVSYNKDTLSYEIFKDAILSLEELKQIKSLCNKLDIDFLSTVGDTNSLSLMEEVNIDGYKISSGLMTNYPLIEKLILIGKPIIFSTGMSEENEIKELISFIESFDFQNYSILHCVSQYPSPAEVINIGYMDNIKQFTSKIVGYSDHYIGETAVLTAVALGAKIVEKHFTFDKTLEGADHKISADANDMKDLVTKIRETEKMLKRTTVRQMSKTEALNKKMFRRKLIVNKYLKKGDIISLTDLDARRFNNVEEGISPTEYKKVLGKNLTRDLTKYSLIGLKDI